MRKAFTLAELLVVVAILSIIAAFGIPNYNEARERADERVGATSMRIIIQALELYKSHNGSYPNFDMSGINAINENLNWGIVEQNFGYFCLTLFGASRYRCDATSTKYGWLLRYTANSNDDDVHCQGGGCPTCSGSSCPF